LDRFYCTWFSCRILLKNVNLPVTWGDRRVANGVRTGSSLLHHFHHRRKNARKLTEEIVIEIGTWTGGTPGIGMSGPRDQIVVTVGLPGTPGHPGILQEMTS
jgi:hypothetical protein